MFLHTSTQSDLLSDLCTHRVGEDDLGEISLDGADAAACRQRADVHHQHLVLRQLLDLQTHTTITTTFKKYSVTGRLHFCIVTPGTALTAFSFTPLRFQTTFPIMHVSPWQPSCLPLCGLPAAF